MKRPCKYNIQDVESITCPYCDKGGFKMLHWGHLKKLHNKTMDDVNKEFPNLPTMTKKESDKRSEVRLKCEQKITDTCNEKYGGVGYKSEILKEKSIETLVNKYGETNIMRVESFTKTYKGENSIYSKKNKPERAKKISEALKGKPSKLKGRSYIQIHGKEKTKILIKKRRISGAIACSKNFNPSRPQVELYELVKKLYPSSVLNYSYSWYNIDIAIINKKIAIEYDGSYWHQDKIRDDERQKSLEELGWKFIRYVDRIPTQEELLKNIQVLT